MSAMASTQVAGQQAVDARPRLNVLQAQLQPALARWVLFRRDDVCAWLSITADEADGLLKHLLQAGQIDLAKDGTGGLYVSPRKSA